MGYNTKVKKRKLIIIILFFILPIILFLVMPFLNRNEMDEETDYGYVLANSSICFVHTLDMSDTKYVQAIEYLTKGKCLEAKNILEDIIEKGKPFSNHLVEGKLLNALGVCNIALSENNNALEQLRTALDLIGSGSGNSSGDTAIVLNNLGVAFMQMIKIDESLDVLVQAKKVENSISEMDKSCVNINYAFNLMMQGKSDESIKIFKHELQKIKGKSDNGKLINAFLKSNLAFIDTETLSPEMAIKYCDDALKVYNELLEQDHFEIAHTYMFKGIIYFNLGNEDESERLFNKALQIQESSQNCSQGMIALIYNNLGTLYQNKNDIDEAIRYYEKAQIIFLKDRELYINAANTYNNIGLCYYSIEEYNNAIKYFLKAYWFMEGDSYNLESLQTCRDNILSSYIELDLDPTKFDEWLEQQREKEIVFPEAA